MSDLNLLKEQIKVCEIHIDRIDIALKKIHYLRPLTIEKLEILNTDDLAYLELLTNRASKLQDLIGSKVFALVLKELGELENKDSFIDRLNKLEKFEIIKSAQHWKDLRDLRNHLSHEYPEPNDFMVKNLNLVFDEAQYLKDLVVKIKNRFLSD